MLLEHADRAPDGLALSDGSATLTWASLERASALAARRLIRAGTEPGDRVVVRMANTVDAVTAAWAVLRAGAVLVPVAADSRPARIATIAADCGAQTTVTPETLLADLGSEGHAANHTLPRRIDVDLAAIIYTSGTSGEPKGVMLAHRNLTNTTAAIATYLGQAQEDVICCLLPLAFSYGLFQALTAGLVGSTLLLERSFAFPFDVLRRAEAHRVTIFPAVPTVFAKLLAMLPIADLDLGSIRIMTNAAAALPPTHLGRLCDAFPAMRFFAMYGQTECTRATYLDPSLARSHPHSVGRAIPNCEAYLIDDAGRRLPDGSEGELVIRGANVMRGYWNRPRETDEKLVPGPTPGERVLRTGDRFRSDAHGLLTFVSRSDEIFKCRGEKVAPCAIEHVLCELPEVAMAAVIGVDDPNDGTAIKAIVVPRAGCELTEARIRQHCRSALDAALMPRFIELRDELPTTASGKVRKLDLLEGRTT
jgi:long-chain acyl-CoA synthetase